MNFSPEIVTEAVLIFNSDPAIRRCSIYVLIVCVILSLITSYSLAFILFGSYILGLLLSFLVITFRSNISLNLARLVAFQKSRSPGNKKYAHSCSICDDLTCRRHQEEYDVTPWKDLIINERLNKAVEKFFSRILDNFVTPWHGRLSNEETFIYEVEQAVKYSTASVVKRIMEIDLPALISRKLLPCAVKHIDDFMYIQEIATLKNCRINTVAIEYLGKRLHGAATNRKNELTYLRELTTALLPLVLPKKCLSCRNYTILFQELVSGWVLLPLMDVLSDPNTINSLIIIGSKYKSKVSEHKELSKEVQFLKNFGDGKNREKSLFFTELDKIKKNTELLYTFMQFLKSEGQVHLLQFCLDVDQFNEKLMLPNLNKKALDELYDTAMIIHKEYISQDSVNYVKCGEETSRNMTIFLRNGVNSITKISPLLQAHKEVSNDLEHNWLPLFFQSNEFYSYLCGSKITAQYNKAPLSKPRRQEVVSSVPVSKISSLDKIKLALKNTPMDAATISVEKQLSDNGGEIETPVCYSIFRNISTWEISISSYVSMNKIIYFHVNVKRPSSIKKEMETHRVVLRKDQDFYTLKAKLVEFHGESEISDCPLPTRKPGSDIGARMAGYERFLKKLAQNSTLRGSDLLHTFLTSEEDFLLYMSTCGAPVQDLGNIYQSVTQKLRKEKGQHLDNFMNIFKSSIGNNESGSFGTLEVGSEMDTSNRTQYIPPPKTYRNYVFNDNFGLPFSKLKKTSSVAVNPESIIDCLFYLGKHIFKMPTVLLRFYVAICSIVREAMESLCQVLVQKKLTYGLSQHHLEYLVTCLQEVIFDDCSDPLTKSEQEDRKRQTLEILNSVSTKLPYKLLGKNFSEGLKCLWNISQHPHYNKQLTYQLLDIVLIELYPSLNINRK